MLYTCTYTAFVPIQPNTANTAKHCVQASIGSAELLCLIADMSESHAKSCTAKHYRSKNSCGRSPTIQCLFVDCNLLLHVM